MNKIEVRGNKIDKEIVISSDTVIYFYDCDCKINYVILDNVRVFEYIENSCIDKSYDIKSDFILNIFSINSSLDVCLDLNCENISVSYSYSTLNENSNNYKININHNYSNQTSNIINHGINLDSNKLSFVVNTIVPKDSININTKQDSKILMVSDSFCLIEPNLIIDNDDIEASHSSYIGDFKNEEVFYLESRGLSNLESKKLLAKSFLMGNMNGITFREIDLIKDKLNMYWR